MSSGVYLAAYLAPLKPWLDRPDVTDIWVNQPGEAWIETTRGETSREAAPDLTEQALGRLARQIAASSHQGVSREHPLLSASLPDGARVQVIGPPATRGGFVLAVRKHTLSDLTLADLGKGGSLPKLNEAASHDADDALRRLHEAGEVEAFLRLAVQRRKTIVLSGGTSSGKTTLLNALVKEIAPHERLVLIEDAPEIQLRHENAVGLIAVRNETGEAQVDAEDLLQATLRMRPDRILLGELRGREAFTFLRAVNTGHPGSITTVHADSARGAIDQIALLSLLSGVDLGWETVRSYVRQVVDVVVQLKRVDGVRRVTELEFLKA
ncbi:P-type DNA transfer ATPase VirB11 [uncultured Caulobacter sp.]|uniref:P-type DNA transfer ATPase VirB11 n=1 Tax=uncultured Caulobacter sp. TaxID=158749 RepID=UPI002639CE48|nr:P-type DNA transfer ATPase VirB11 [uncultured Caulobacter sp.]